MEYISELERMGYIFTLQDDRLTYEYRSSNNPPQEAEVLLACVRSNRDTAIREFRIAERQRRIEDADARLYKRYADNIRKSEVLRTEINKAVNAGAPAHEVLPIAIACIQAMTGDTIVGRQLL